jgi:hypothetical protein
MKEGKVEIDIRDDIESGFGRMLNVLSFHDVPC